MAAALRPRVEWALPSTRHLQPGCSSRAASTRTRRPGLLRPGEILARADPNQLVPEIAALSPATEAWYVLRLSVKPGRTPRHGFATRAGDDRVAACPRACRIWRRPASRSMRAYSAKSAERTPSPRARTTWRIARTPRSDTRSISGSPKQLQQVLFDELRMPKTRSKKTGFSTDAASLADLQEQAPHPFLDLLLQHRDATKLKQIIETLERGVKADGRIHTTYDQTGTSTGRISSNDPNLQNIPVKTAVGREIRSAFERGSASRRFSRRTTRRSKCGSWRTSPSDEGSSRRSTRGRTFTASSVHASSASRRPR